MFPTHFRFMHMSVDFLLFETVIPWFAFQYLRNRPFFIPENGSAFIFKLQILLLNEISLISFSQGVSARCEFI